MHVCSRLRGQHVRFSAEEGDTPSSAYHLIANSLHVLFVQLR